MIIEAAQHALPPKVFVQFARENAHWYRPETLRTIFRCGYWPLGATRAVVATIKESRPKGGRVAYCGACDGSGIEFGDARYLVELFDPVPMGPRVAERAQVLRRRDRRALYRAGVSPLHGAERRPDARDPSLLPRNRRLG